MVRFVKTNISTGLMALCLAASVNAAPGTISDTPLFISSIAKPNIMFLLDDSGSMGHVVPDSATGYDSSATYIANCGAATILPTNGESVSIHIVGGIPKVKYSGTDYEWGTGIGNICFDPALSYQGAIHANNSNAKEPQWPVANTSSTYTGHFLNWYFDTTNTTPTWTSGQTIKPGMENYYRLKIAQDSLTSLINSLGDSVRIGLATYYGSDGGTLERAIADLTAAHKTTLLTDINAITTDTYTPLAESLHEIGRYFVGTGGGNEYNGNLTLHPGNVSGTETILDDDVVFPQYLTNAGNIASPITAWCQKNFVVILTDGQSTEDTNIAAATGLTDYDGDCVAPVSPATCSTTDDKKDNRTYAANGSDYLDDIAYALQEMDLRPDLNDSDGNEFLNNIYTYIIGFADDDVLGDPLMSDTADHGGGLFLTASDSTSLVSAFEDAIDGIIAQTGSAAAVTFNSGNFSSDSAIFQAFFDSTRWSGEVKSFPLNSNGTIDTGCTIGTTNCWIASTLLDADTPSARNIITSTGSNTGIPFEWVTSGATALSATQQADLNTKTDGTTDAFGQARLEYLRGDRTCEISSSGSCAYDLDGDGSSPGDSGDKIFRPRTSVLGDVIDATPLFIGEPPYNYPDTGNYPNGTASYATFKTANASRNEIVYVGANDGMLHAFDADTGDELMAFIPHTLFDSSASNTGLHYLSDSSYAHKYYVDLPPTAADVYMDDGGGAAWKSVLIGGLRGGGRGLFALDVTNPTNFDLSSGTPATKADAVVMWEFNSGSCTDCANLGETFSEVTIAMTNTGSPKRWAAIFGNGYNNTGDGKAKLFIVFLDGGLDGTWTDGSGSSDLDYIILDTGVGSINSSDCSHASSDCNGLSSPALVDMDADGTVDRVYAGDLEGNMWVFDISATNSNSWGSAYVSGTTPEPLFIAATDTTDASTVNTSRQPITAKPTVSLHPTQAAAGNGSNVLVFFGTGQYLTTNDVSDTTTQSFYAVWDRGVNSPSPTVPAQGSTTVTGISRLNLQSQLTNDTSINASNSAIRVSTNNTVDYADSDSDGVFQYGWYMDMLSTTTQAQEGERIITMPTILGDNIFFNTIIPDNTVCEAGGTGFLMSVTVVDGARPASAAFDNDGDGVLDTFTSGGTDYTLGGSQFSGGGQPGQSGFLGNNQYTMGTDDSTATQRKVDPGESSYTGRLSWEQLINN